MHTVTRFTNLDAHGIVLQYLRMRECDIYLEWVDEMMFESVAY